MGEIYVRIKKNDFKKLAKAAPGKAAQAMDALAEEGVTISKLSMQESPATGRTYTRGTVTHTASSPGNPPRPDLGFLINSIRWERQGDDRRIVAATEYAAHLEFGTNSMEPRPFFGPMAKELETSVGEIFDGFLE